MRIVGRIDMRLLFGMIIGAALTIGGAYISDTWPTGTANGTAEHRPMVNWDVVSNNFATARERAQEVWNNLSRKMSG